MPYLPQNNIIKKTIRRNSYDRGYDNSWKIVRKHHLQNEPLCRDCLAIGKYVPGKDIHHIIKLKERPDLRDDTINLMTLCKRCHSIRTAAGE